VAQLYVTGGPRHARERLAGWARVTLKPGESRAVTIDVDPRLLADWDEARHDWTIAGGVYTFALGGSAADLRASVRTRITPRQLPP
jgi:beta-glucosidase